jgi:hypothetical protein
MKKDTDNKAIHPYFTKFLESKLDAVPSTSSVKYLTAAHSCCSNRAIASVVLTFETKVSSPICIAFDNVLFHIQTNQPYLQQPGLYMVTVVFLGMINVQSNSLNLKPLMAMP